MNAESIVGRTIGEAGDGTEYVGKPGRRLRARALHRRSAHRMLEGLLCFAIVVEAELIHCGVVDRPGSTEVPLLESLVGGRSETGHVRAGSLELRKRRDYVVIIEIVVKAEVLFGIEPVIDLDRKLVAASGLHGYGLNQIGASRGSRNKLKQIHGGGIHAFQRNLVVGKNVG